MADNLDKIRAELVIAKANLSPTADARSARGKAVRNAIDTRRGRAEWRKAVFSVRCLPELPGTIRDLAKAKGMNVAEWFEALVEAEVQRGKE